MKQARKRPEVCSLCFYRAALGEIEKKQLSKAQLDEKVCPETCNGNLHLCRRTM